MSVSTISIIASVVVILILLLFFISGWRKGFLRILFTTFSIVITIAVSGLLTEPSAGLLQEKTFVGPFVQEKVSAYVNEKTADLLPQAAVGGASEVTDEETSDIRTEDDFIDSLLLPVFVKDIIKGRNNITDYAKLQVADFQEYMASQITGIIIKIIAFLLLMIIVFILLRLIIYIIKFVDRIPVIHGINHLLGAVLSLAEALIIIWLLCLLLSLFAGSEFGSDVLRVIHASSFLTFIYENNLISKGIHLILPL